MDLTEPRVYDVHVLMDAISSNFDILFVNVGWPNSNPHIDISNKNKCTTCTLLSCEAGKEKKINEGKKPVVFARRVIVIRPQATLFLA